MKLAVYALTRGGQGLAERLATEVAADLVVDFTALSLRECLARDFSRYDGLVLIMACGIAVRLLASLLVSKTSDPAVVVLDEQGKFAISLLSGHLGGANQLATSLAALSGGQAVITTATDLYGLAAFDLLAQANGCRIENITALKTVSAALVNGGQVDFYCDSPCLGDSPPGVVGVDRELIVGSPHPAVWLSHKVQPQAAPALLIRPPNLVIGIGCRRDTSLPAIEAACRVFLAGCAVSALSLTTLASIDRKQDEPALQAWAAQRHIPFVCFSTQELAALPGDFAHSDFVAATTGVGSVCERAALCAAGPGGRLLQGKTIIQGITFALVEKDWVFRWN